MSEQECGAFLSIAGGKVLKTGFTRESFPYMIIKDQNGDRTLCIVCKSGVEAQEPGYLQITDLPTIS